MNVEYKDRHIFRHLPFNTVLFYISSYVHCIAGAHFRKLAIFGESEGVAHDYSVSKPPFLILLIRAPSGRSRPATRQLIDMRNPLPSLFCRVISIAWGKGPSTTHCHVCDYVFFKTKSVISTSPPFKNNLTIINVNP